jgi:hypothetical protein
MDCLEHGGAQGLLRNLSQGDVQLEIDLKEVQPL